MSNAENIDIQRRLPINEERMGRRCKRSVGGFHWLVRTKSVRRFFLNRIDAKRTPVIDIGVVVKNAPSWLTEFSTVFFRFVGVGIAGNNYVLQAEVEFSNHMIAN